MSDNSHIDHQLKRMQIRWSAYKAIGVAFVATTIVGITSSVINWQIRQKEVAIEELKATSEVRVAQLNQQRDYLQSFVQYALDQNLHRKIDFAEYVAFASTSEELRAAWMAYYKRLEERGTDTRQDLIEAKKELQNFLTSGEEKNAAQQARILDLQQAVLSLQNEVGDVVPPNLSLQDAISRLARERTSAEVCVSFLKRYGDEQSVINGERMYTTAKASVDGYISRLLVAIAAEDPVDVLEIGAKLADNVRARHEFCKFVENLTPSGASKIAWNFAAGGHRKHPMPTLRCLDQRI